MKIVYRYFYDEDGNPVVGNTYEDLVMLFAQNKPLFDYVHSIYLDPKEADRGKLGRLHYTVLKQFIANSEILSQVAALSWEEVVQYKAASKSHTNKGEAN